MNVPTTVEEYAGYLFVSLTTFFFTWVLNRKKNEVKNDQIEEKDDEIRNLRAALAYREGKLVPVLDWSTQAQIDRKIQLLRIDLEIQRTLMLFACNGKQEPTEVSSLWIRNDHNQKEDNHYRLTLDDDYRERLYLMKKYGHFCFPAKDAPDNSLIGGIYRDLGVKHSLWTILYYDENEKLGIAGYVFMSWVRFVDNPFTEEDIRKILAVVNFKSRKMLDKKEKDLAILLSRH